MRRFRRPAALLAIVAICLRIGFGVGAAMALDAAPAGSDNRLGGLVLELCGPTGKLQLDPFNPVSPNSGLDLPHCPLCLAANQDVAVPEDMGVEPAPRVVATVIRSSRTDESHRSLWFSGLYHPRAPPIHP